MRLACVKCLIRLSLWPLRPAPRTRVESWKLAIAASYGEECLPLGTVTPDRRSCLQVLLYDRLSTL